MKINRGMRNVGTNQGRLVVDTTYTIIEVHHIHHWTSINIVREHADDQ